MPLIDDEEEELDYCFDSDGEEEEEKVYEVEAKLKKDDESDGSLSLMVVKFPLNYSSSTTQVADIENQVAQRMGLNQGTFKIIYLDIDQDFIWMKTKENLIDALSCVNHNDNVLHLEIRLD